MPVAMCPSAEQLAAFQAGRLAHDQLDSVAEHLEACTTCQAALEAVGTQSDPLLRELQQAQETDAFANESGCHRAVAQVEAIVNGAATQTRDETSDSAEVAPRTAPPSKTLGKYQLHEAIGRGGMGEVYRATHTVLKKVVAVKLLSAARMDSPDAVARFRREIEAAGQLDHPHIVRASDADFAEGQHFLVMEWLDGFDLGRMVRQEGPLPVEQACDFIRQAALGLDCAHQHGLVHRDVKPSNLMLTTVDGRPMVKVLDLGLALLNDNVAAEAGLTSSGQVMGTFDFISPEQAMESHAVDARADMYSLGCTFYYLLTGQTPYRGKSEAKKLLAHQLENPTPMAQYRSDVPAEVIAVVSRMMARDPRQRFSSMRAVAETLNQLSQKLARTKAPANPAQKTARPKWPWMAAAAAVLIGVGLLVWHFATTGDIRISTPDGDYVINTDDPDFSFQVSKGTVTLTDSKSGRKYKLNVLRQEKGEFVLDVTDLGAELSFKVKEFTIKRGERVALKAHFERKPAAQARGTPVDDAWIKVVQALPAEKRVDAVAQKLKDLNPGFDGKVSRTIEDNSVIGLEFLSDNVSDISAVRALPELRDLRCGGSHEVKGQLAVLAPLKEMKLKKLEFMRTRVADLSPIADMKLTYLDCSDTEVTDLSPLGKSMDLKSLMCGHGKVKDLAPLKNLKLTTLYLRGARDLVDLTPLQDLRLEFLDCHYTSVRDLAPLKDMKLTHLYISSTGVSDLSTLKDMPLVELNCSETLVSNLAPLKDMPLKDLRCSQTNVSDLTPLEHMRLRYLEIVATKVANLSSLKNVSIRELCCDFRPERDAVLLRSIKTLASINGKPATDFWKEVDAQLAASPFLSLKAADIPNDERFAFQPKELVAVLGTHRGKHWGRVNDVAASPNGKLIATAGDDWTVRLWDAETLKEVAILRGHQGVVRAVAFSHDGKLLASAGIGEPVEDGVGGTVRVWSLEGKEPALVHTLPWPEAIRAKEGGYFSLAFHPRKRLLAAGRAFGAGIARWNLDGAKPQPLPDLPADHCTTLTFSPNGTWFAAGDRSAVRLWDVTGEKFIEKGMVKEHKDGVGYVAFSPDSTRLVTIGGTHDSGDSRVLIWELGPGRPGEKPLAETTIQVASCATFYDRGRVLVGSYSDLLFAWDWQGKGVPERISPEHDVEVRRIARINGNRLIGAHRGLMLLDLEKKNDIRGVHLACADFQWPNSLCVSRRADRIVFGVLGQIHVWSLGNGKINELPAIRSDERVGMPALGVPENGIAYINYVRNTLEVASLDSPARRLMDPLTVDHNLSRLAPAADGRLLAAGTGLGKVIILSGLNEKKPQKVFEFAAFEKGYVGAMSISPNGRRIAIFGAKVESLCVFDLSESSTKACMAVQLKRVDGLAFHPDGKRLVSVSAFAGNFLWDLEQPGGARKSLPVPNETMAACISEDGKLIAVAGPTGASVVEVSTLKLLHQWPLPDARTVAFAPDNRHVVVGNANGTVYVMRLP